MDNPKIVEPSPLEWITRLEPLLVGANVTFFAATLAQLPNRPAPYFPGSFGLYLLLTIANLYPVGLLLAHSSYRAGHLPARARSVFGFLSLEWISSAAFGIEVVKSGATDLLRAMLPALGAGVLLLMAWKIVVWRIERSQKLPESMFP